jgi:phosphate-selective porin OprO and OprP
MKKKMIARVPAHGFIGGVLLATGLAWGQQPDSTEERIKKLEEQLQGVMEELARVKQEAAANKQKAQAPVQPPTETQALKKEVEQLKGQVAEVQEQATATDAKVEQNGVRAYLGPGLVFEDPRGRWRMQVSGRAQLDYRAFAPSFTDANTFSIRRARIGVAANVLDDYGVYVEEEFANQATNPAPSTGPQLTFAYVDLNWFRPGARFRLGQFKPSIGLDNTMLDLQTDFLERALTQSLLGSVYDAGIQAFGEPTPGLFYSASVTNGSGQGNSEPEGNLSQAQHDGKMWTVRLVNDFAQTFKIPDSVVHLGGTYQHTGLANSGVNNQTVVSATSVQTEARGLTFFIPQPFNPANAQAVISSIDRSITDIEAAFARGPFKIQGDYVQAQHAGNVLATGADFDRSLKAYYVTLGWVISGEYYSDWYREGTFVRPRPKNNFGWKKGDGWGLWEANFRFSSFDGTDFNNGNPNFTGRPGPQRGVQSSSFPNITQGTNKAQAYTFGLKWQPNLYTRLMFNLIHTEFDTPVVVNGKSTDYENAFTFRAQVDF